MNESELPGSGGNQTEIEDPKWLGGRGLRREPLVFLTPVCPVSFQCLASALLPKGGTP